MVAQSSRHGDQEPMLPLEDVERPHLGSKELFYRYFQDEVTALQKQMQQLENDSSTGGERQGAIDHCLAGITHLSKEVADASIYIPAYDQRMYSEAIKALTEKLQETRARIKPRPKFSFKSSRQTRLESSSTDAAEQAANQSLQPPRAIPRDRPSAGFSMPAAPLNFETPLNDASTFGDSPLSRDYNAEMAYPECDGSVRRPSFSQASSVAISGHQNLHIVLPSSASRATSAGSLKNLNDCIVDMSVPTMNGAPFAGLALRAVNNSLIIAGHVAGAAHITGVVNSIIAVSSRQVRMHDCKNVDIYLLCSSRPIIEDCCNVRFAPIPKFYIKPSKAPVINQWDQVDDFKWLKAEHSPNWSIIPENERMEEEIWTMIAPGGPSTSVKDILWRAGIEH